MILKEKGRLLPVLLIFVLLLPFLGGLCQPVTASAADKVKLYGVDISTYQGDVDWPMLAGNNINFVIMRGGKRPTETDEYFKDDRFEQNYAGARSVGLKIGVYLYCGATTWETFEATVYAFLESIEGKQFDYPVYLDVESDAQTALGKEIMTQYVLDALAIITEAGYPAGVYANLNWFKNFLDGEAIAAQGYPLWLARYTYDCDSYDYSDTYSMWQYSDKGNLKGHGGTAIDLDVSYVDFNYHPELHPTPDEAYAPYLPLKAHTLENAYFAPYYADMETKIGGASVFPSDECVIREVYTNGWCRFSYPTNAGDRIGYLPVSVFLPEPPGNYVPMQAESLIMTYSRADLTEGIGWIDTNDNCWIVLEQNETFLAIYPVSGGWKLGWYPLWSAEDAVLVMEYLHGKRILSQRQTEKYNLNDDDMIDVFDLGLVRRKILGIG